MKSILKMAGEPDKKIDIYMYEMSQVMRRPVYVICSQQRPGQSDQHLYCSLPR